jgi:endonuclease YncB( thermonuclease family)
VRSGTGLRPVQIVTGRRVIDGDTLLIAIDVAPEKFHTEKLRLRGLDCPELSTVEGKAAKRFSESLLPPGMAFIVATTKPDRYERYLADVFVTRASGEAVFLNNVLLENGHAERKDEWEFGDWD